MKTTKEVNGSPKLVFIPNNDTDDYTLAIAYTNEKFARIRVEEWQNVTESVAENVIENVCNVFSSEVVSFLLDYSKKKWVGRNKNASVNVPVEGKNAPVNVPVEGKNAPVNALVLLFLSNCE